VRIVFFGIYQIGVLALDRLNRGGLDIVAVVTKPGSDVEHQPVALYATENGLTFMEPHSPGEPGFIAAIEALKPDLIVVAGYHKIIPKAILDIPAGGTINLHGSLLPRYRGPCTWKWAIMNGEAATGVTVHIMTPQLDNGDILGQRVIPILDTDTGGSLVEKISVTGAELLFDTIAGIQAGTVERTPQDEDLASYYGYPSEQDTRIHWERGAEQIRNLIRGLTPGQGAWTMFNGKRVHIVQAELSDRQSTDAPGAIVDRSQSRFTVATSTCDLIVNGISLNGYFPTPVSQLFKLQGTDSGTRFEP